MLSHIEQQMHKSKLDNHSFWDEAPCCGKVIDFDDDDEDSMFCSGHDSFLSLYVKDVEAISCKLSAPIFKDVQSVKGQVAAFYSSSELSTQGRMLDQSSPLLSCIFDDGLSPLGTKKQLDRCKFLQQSHDELNCKGIPRECTDVSIDQQLAIAQYRLEESIRQTQISRPQFIQACEIILSNLV